MQICTCTTIKGVLTVHIIQIWKKNNRWFSPLDLHQPIQKLLQAFLNHAIKNAWTQDHEAVLYLSQNLYTVWLSSSFSTQNHRGLKLHVSPSMYFTTILQKPIHDTFWDFLGKKWRFDNLGAKEFICRPKKEGTYYKQVQIIFAKITKDD